jgi:hypothetical protein
MADEQATKEEVLGFIKALNESWTKGDGSGLGAYFHPRMVAITPSDQDILYGRDACVKSWLGFAQQAQIRRWEELEPDVKLYGDTAIVTYYYDISFDMEGESYDQGGRDMLVLVKENGSWRAVADHYSTFPEQEG